jgi:predicted transcriptional regulator
MAEQAPPVDGPTQRLLATLLAHHDTVPLNIRQLAKRCGWSQNTAGKYVQVAKAAGWIQTRPFATAILVQLTSTGRRNAEKSAAREAKP